MQVIARAAPNTQAPTAAAPKPAAKKRNIVRDSDGGMDGVACDNDAHDASYHGQDASENTVSGSETSDSISGRMDKRKQAKSKTSSISGSHSSHPSRKRRNAEQLTRKDVNKLEL